MNQEEVLKAYWNIIGHYKEDYAVLQNEEGKLAVIDAKENEAPSSAPQRPKRPGLR